MSDLRVAYYGDDFTGSVDVLLQFARRGWTGRLFAGLPPADLLAQAVHEVDVVGIAGIARSLPTEDLEAEVRPALEALTALRPAVVQYKACSTADSSPLIGSLGRVVEIGRDVVGRRPVPVLFAQPDFGRYTLFGHHFAREGDVVYRLDRQPTMSTHPSTPMTESDLAVHLSRQTRLPIESMSFTAYTSANAIADGLARSGAGAVVLDAADDAHLALIGRAVLSLTDEDPVFALGSGGLSYALAGAAAGSGGALPRETPARGPVIAVSGSRSSRTREQMDAAAAAGWLVAPMPLDSASRSAAAARAVEALNSGRSVAFSSDDADVTGLPAGEVLPALADSAAGIVAAVARNGAASRAIVCGGDTSSRVTTMLGIHSLSIAANPTGNIVLLAAHAADPAIDGIELLLKGGQVGDADLFERIRTLGAESGSPA